ncbi:hypothetical protein GpartN1_g3089.t1 [Galdieria partita]|uniref:Probable ATP-dependent transporter ycf16 n=1 Tax=Galdieria partita TaxID=83374 RepID=A0A9C7PUV5_9RHOD|nr:hypothetical protein GpartN1_g3089.t1 [Galdieria partita]
MDLERTEKGYSTNNSSEARVEDRKLESTHDKDENSSFREGYPMQRDYFGILRDLEEKFEGEDFYTEEMKNRRYWKYFRFMKPKTYELKARVIEESLGEWYKEPRFDVDSPNFDRDAYAELIQTIYETMGFHERIFGVSFHGLSVQVPVSAAPAIPTVWTSAVATAKNLLKLASAPFKPIERNLLKKEEPVAEILSNISGYVLPGEMLLVLGPPGSGTSTLLNVLANHVPDSFKVTGKVSYGGLKAHRKLHHVIRHVGQDDVHLPTLSVWHTFEFAANCSIPDFFPFAKRIRYDRIRLVARGLGLERVLRTRVGGPRVRGVSGGEKKRVTIGEMLVGSRAQLFVFDQFTKGLDSAVSLDIVRSMRRSVDRDKRVFIVSMQQPSEDIYWLFDRVLVIDQGKELFFGRVSEALPYFESIGIRKPLRRSVPEFLCSLSDPKHTLICPGFEEIAPTNVASFEEKYRDSIYHKKVLAALSNGYAEQDISRRRPVASEISDLLERRVLQPFHTQLKLCVLRQFRMDLNNRGTLLFRFCRYIFMGLVLGALFFKEPRDKQGSLAVVGALFISLMQMGLGSISTLPNIFEQRAVLYKQTSANFILPQPFFIAQMLEEAPVYFLEVVFYSSSLYWMAGLNPMNDGQRFLFFIFIYWILDLVMSAQTRLIAVGTPVVEVATALSPAIVITNIVFAGFILPRGSIPPWWIWLYYLSPFHYTFVSSMINQFDGLRLFCTTSELEPTVSYIPNAFKTCPVSTGAEYIQRQFQIDHPYGWKFYNVLILVGFYTLYSVLGVMCVTFLKFSTRKGGKRAVNKKRSSVEVNRELDEELRVFRERYESTVNIEEVSQSIYFVAENGNYPQRGLDNKAPSSSNSFSKDRDEGSFSGTDVLQSDEHLSLKEIYFTWKHLYYIIPKESQKKGLKQRLFSKKTKFSENDLVLLNDVTGYAVPGRLVALMGSSGAGKTTLLDVLARRKTFGKILGSVELNREPVHISFRRINGYVEQEDIHVPQPTIREAITFSAMLRLPSEVPREKKILAVERILDILELRDVENRMVGFGLPPETKKRVTIGVELVVNPLVLFLDEPTSGLDARAALVVMRAIRRIAHAGHTVVCTIHQPSTEIFEMFDDLLLLQRGGHVVYFGPLGVHSKVMIDYFVRNGATPIQQGRNPADWMLEVVGAGISNSQTKDWSSVWKNSGEYRRVLAELGELDNTSQLEQDERQSLENVTPIVPENVQKVTFRSSVASTFRDQVVEVTKRIFICYWRFPSYNWTRFVIAVVMSLLVGSAFYKFPHDQQGARNSIAVLYMGAMYGVMQQTSSINPMFQMRDAFYREVAAGTYYPIVYWIAIGLVEMPFSLVPGTVYVLILYFLAGFPASKFGFFYFNFFIFMWSAISLGQTVATFSPNPMVAYMLNPVLNSLQSALAGFVIPEPSIPVYFKWLYWIDPYRYLLEAISTNTIHNFSYYCTSSEYRYFSKPPSWPSCEVNSNNQSTPYVNAPVGLCSAVNVNNHIYDSCCRYCPITSGSQVLSEFGLQYWRRWDDLGALVGFWWVFRLATLFGLQFIRWVQR